MCAARLFVFFFFKKKKYEAVGKKLNTRSRFRSPCAALKMDFLTKRMHLLYALVRKSSFSARLRETGSWETLDCTTLVLPMPYYVVDHKY